MDKIHKIVVPPAGEGMRVDVFLTAALPELTRSRIKSLSEMGRLHIAGVPAKASYKLLAGEAISLLVPAPAPSGMEAEFIPLEVVFEDNELIVINKPAGIVTHPACGRRTGTLANAVLFHCPSLEGVGGLLRPGVVHRLDKDTSGLIVFAKTDAAHQALSTQFQRREVQKHYLALVMGSPNGEAGEINLPIGRHPRERKLMSTGGKRAKEALTQWRVLERLPFCSLLEVAIKTGRTHQIRVHLNSFGFPVVGDAAYGKSNFTAIVDTAIRARLRSFPRQALHAASLSFVHPRTAERLVFSVPLPADIGALLDFLKSRLANSQCSLTR